MKKKNQALKGTWVYTYTLWVGGVSLAPVYMSEADVNEETLRLHTCFIHVYQKHASPSLPEVQCVCK